MLCTSTTNVSWSLKVKVMSNVTKLSDARMGEIALMMIIQQIAKDLPTAEALRRDLPNSAKALGVAEDEARAFIEQILPKAIGLRLGCESVGLVFRRK